MKKKNRILLISLLSFFFILGLFATKIYVREETKALPSLNENNQSLNRSLEANYDSLNRLSNIITEEYKNKNNDIGPYNLSTKNTSEFRTSNGIKEKKKFTDSNRDIVESIKGKSLSKEVKSLMIEYKRVDDSTRIIEREKGEIVSKYNNKVNNPLVKLLNRNVSTIE